MTKFFIEAKISGDGSTTFYRPDIDEHYHSIHGAIQESEHIFIKAGLMAVDKTNLNILEVGFGTGLNAFLTLLRKQSGNIYYHTIEKYPIDNEMVKKINYPTYFTNENAAQLFHQIDEASWGVETCITNDFWLTKLNMDLLDFSAEDIYDLVYFDAFAPEKQPELWSNQVFEMLYKSMRHGGILTTYCAKGSVKRSMMAAGFKVKRLPGPPVKRHIIRAVKLSE
jgi:tRNA U34 5-methylaminomethyl-2-thiouridine-forming methyltransferase MnmC